jgi:hypothetical protein
MDQGEALEWRDAEVPAFKTCRLLWWKQRVAFQKLLRTKTGREGGMQHSKFINMQFAKSGSGH